VSFGSNKNTPMTRIKYKNKMTTQKQEQVERELKIILPEKLFLLDRKLFQREAFPREESTGEMINYLRAHNYEVASAEQVVRAGLDLYASTGERIQSGAVREAYVYVPNKGGFITKNNPILNHPSEEIEFSKKNPRTIYHLPDKQISEALKGALPLLDFPNTANLNRKIAEFLFGDSFTNSYENLVKFSFGTRGYARAGYPLASCLVFEFDKGIISTGGELTNLFTVQRGSEKRLNLGTGKYVFYTDLVKKVRNGSLPNCTLDEIVKFFQAEVEKTK
jgi:hypothetical protein